MKSSTLLSAGESYERSIWLRGLSTGDVSRSFLVDRRLLIRTVALLSTLLVALISQAQTPRIASVSPLSGPVGTQVQINGSGFGASQGQVSFNSAGAAIVSWSDNQIVATVPPAATSGPVVVTESGLPSAGTFIFTVPAPSVTSVSPTGGIPGTQVTITGTGFQATQPNPGVVYFNGTSANINSWSDTQIVATVPGAATTGSLWVAVNGVSSNQNVQFTMLNPIVTSLSPSSGPVSTQVHINGSGFGATQGTSTVAFNGVTATIVNWSSTQITATVPSSAVTGLVIVTVGGVASNNGIYFTVPAPHISSISPTGGVPGAQITITGSGFQGTQGSSSILFNSSAPTVNSWSDTQIKATIASGTTTGPVSVKVNGVSSNQDVVLATPNPVVTGLSPWSGPGNTQVQINGAGFGSTQGSSTVTLAGRPPATIISWSDTQIVATVLSYADTGPVSVTVSGVASNSDNVFTVLAPQVTSVSPTSGPTGTPVTITGSNFETTRPVYGNVYFNGVSATITSWNNTQIVATVPPTATTGPVTVSVLFSGGGGNKNIIFTMPNPVVTSVTPATGPVNTQVQVNGSGFGATQGSSTLSFNGVNASVITWSDTQIVAKVPLTATSGSVTVTEGGVTSNTSVYYTVPAPQITSISPTSGGVGTQVTVSGSGFQDTQPSAGYVYFNGTFVSKVTNWSSTQFVATVPAGATTGPVKVTINGIASNQDAEFTMPNPVITGLSPASGAVNAQVQINGIGFGATQGSVTFSSGKNASIVTWSDTQITALVPVGATTGPVTVTQGGVVSNSNLSFSVGSVDVNSVSPSAGPINTSVTVSGSGFGASPGSLFFNNTAATTISSWSDSQIIALVPSGATTGPVKVVNGGVASNTTINFTVGTVVVTGVTPSSALPGTQVQISGSGFGPTQGTVTLGSVSATITSWSSTQISVNVPSSTYATGPVKVTAGGVASNTDISFTVLVPAVNSVSPSGGPVGTSVQINGTNFGTAQSTVTFNGTAGTINTWNNTQIVATVPPSATSGPVKVTVGGLDSNINVYFTVPVPQITSISPNSGVVGTQVTISGSGFQATRPASGNVYFNSASQGVAASIVTWSDTQIVATVPPGAISGGVRVLTNVYSNQDVGFTMPAPAVAGLTPSTGPVGTSVQINGSGFGASQGSSTIAFSYGTAPYFNYSNATVVSWSDTQIVATVPTTATLGPVKVTVGGVDSNTNVYFAVPAPQIASISPTSGVANTQVTITGSGFQATQGSSTLYFTSGNSVTSPTINSWSDTQILATVGSNVTTGPVKVYVNNAVSNQNVQFTVPNPAITGLVPSSGPVGTQVQINGVGFGAAQGSSTLVFSGSGSPTIVSWSDIQIVAQVPATAASGPVKVIEGGVTSNTNINFTIPTPQISSISPSTGMLGTQVTVTGSGFESSQGAGYVTFNGTTAPVVSWSDTQILVTVPANAGTGPVKVYAGGTVSNPNIFFTMKQAHITNIVPPYGRPGTRVTIYGVGFGASQGDTSVNFGNIPAQTGGWGDGAVSAVVPYGFGSGSVGLAFPDGGQSDGNPGFGPCGNQYNTFPGQTKPPACVTDLTVSPTVVTGSQPVTLTFAATIANLSYYIPPFDWLVMDTSPGPIHPCLAPATDSSSGCQVSTDSATMQLAFPNGAAGFGPGVHTATYGAQMHGFSDYGAAASVTFIGDGTPNGTPDNGPCPPCQEAGSPINLTTGNTYIQQADYTLPGLGGGISLSRTWNSQWSSTAPLTVAGMFGDSWRSTYEERIQTTSTGVNYWLSDGKVWRFALNAGAYTLTSPMNAYGSLQFASQQYTLAFPDGTKKIFDNNGYLNQIIDGNGNTTVLAYDGSNHLIQVTDAASRTLNFNYGDGGNPNQVTGIQDSVGAIANYQYDSSSHLVTVTYADNSQINYAYDANSMITSVTDGNGKVLEAHTYDGQRRGLSSQRANGVDLVYVSYPSPGLTHVVDSLGNASDYRYAAIGEKHVLISMVGSGCASCTNRTAAVWNRDGGGNATATLDANDNTTLATYDASGNLLTSSTPLNGHMVTWQYTYNSFNEVVTAIDPLGNTTTNAYDGNGNLVSVTTPSPDGSTPGSVTSFAYDPKGELTSITDPLNHTTTLAYYPTGLLHTITDAQNNVTTYTYDGRGNRTSVVDAAGQTTSFQYDALNRLTQITHPDLTMVKFAYDARGRRISATDGNGKITSYTYDDADRLISVTDAANNVTQYAYDSENNLTGITDANLHTTAFQYDAWGRVVKTTFPSTKTETYIYDNVGNLTSKTDRKSQTIRYSYDALNRLVSKAYPDSSSVAYTYDDSDHLTEAQDPTGTYSFLSDNMGRLKQATSAYAFASGGPFTVAYGYDAASNRTGITDLTNGTVSYVYDTLNRLTTITDFNNNSFGFAYDVLGRRTQLTRPNSITTSYAYDSVSNLQSVLHKLGVNTLDGAAYTYDLAGNRKSKSNLLNGAVSNFAYDNIYQLTGVTGTSPESYTYDPVGNRLSSLNVPSYTYNSSNQLTAASSATYTYDNNGNTLTKTDSTGNTTYTWDFENRLTSVQMPNQTTVTFKYDPFGRRIEKNASVYVYDGDNLIEEASTSGSLVARYVFGPGIDEPLAAYRSGAAWKFYQADSLGSITSLSTTAGAVSDSFVYDSFGNLAASSGSSVQPFQYTGRDYDPETGLHYYRARYYDASIGRFLSADPIGFDSGQPNFYDYVGNDPVGLADPFGLKSWPLPLPQPPGKVLPWPSPEPGPSFCIRFPLLCGLALPLFPMNMGQDLGAARCASELGAPGCSGPYGDQVLNYHHNIAKQRCANNNCKPCDPPVGTISYRLDATGRAHRGVPTPHWHLYVMMQNPNTCECFWSEINDNQGGFGAGPPPSGTNPMQPAAGGGRP